MKGPTAALLAIGKRFYQFADGLYEQLRDWAERAVLQRGDANRLPNIGQFHGQCFESEMFTRQEKREAQDGGEEALWGEQLVAQNDGTGRHGKPRRINAGCAKAPRLHGAEIGVRRI